MSNQEAIALLRNLEDSLDAYCELNEEGKTAFRMAIEALNCSEFPNSSDTISRQQAIDALADMHCKSDEDGYVWIIRSDAWARIDALPSVQPELEKKTGKKGQIYIGGVQEVMRPAPAPTRSEMIDILTRRHDALVAVWMTADTPEQYKLAREIGAIEKMLRLYGAM